MNKLFTPSKIQGFLINAAIIVLVMMVVNRVTVLRKLVLGQG